MGTLPLARSRRRGRKRIPASCATRATSSGTSANGITGNSRQQNFDFGRAYSGKHWIKEPDGTRIHVTQKNENDALEFLRTRPSEKPFCLTLAFFATHAEDSNPLQFLPQPQSMALYKDVAIPVPKTATEEAFRKLPSFIANEKNESRVRWHWRFDSPEKFQEMMKNYYRLATEVDATCGRVMAELKKQGMLENTLVIFTTDNGYFHAEHGLADKWYPHQESIRVPLIVRDPRMAAAKRGATNDDFTLNVDLAPTILAAAGMQSPDDNARDATSRHSTWPRRSPSGARSFSTSTRSSGATSAKFPRPRRSCERTGSIFTGPTSSGSNSFGSQRDPLEENDVATNPAHAAQVAAMRARFAELKAAAR